MRTRRLHVPVTYYHASWHRVIVGVRRCPPHNIGGEASVLAELHDASPGWQTLAVCEQQPVLWGKGCALRLVAETPGSVAEDIPYDLWHPVGS